jgi:hypothetical protein
VMAIAHMTLWVRWANKKDIDVNEHRPLPSITIRQKLKLLFCSQDSYLV